MPNLESTPSFEESLYGKEDAKELAKDQAELDRLKLSSGRNSPEYKDSVQEFMAKWQEPPKGEAVPNSMSAAPAVKPSAPEPAKQEPITPSVADYVKSGPKADELAEPKMGERPIDRFEREVASIKPAKQEENKPSELELDVGAKIDAARDKYEQDKKDLGQKEAYMKLATALLNLGAAYYAGKSGANMEGYKGMDLPDLSKEREELGRDYSRNLDYYEKRQNAEQKRKERVEDSNAAMSKEERGRAYSAAELKYKQAMDDEIDRMKLKAARTASSEDDYQKRLAELNEAKNQLLIMQTDPDEKVQATAKRQMMEHLGNARVPAADIGAATTKIDNAWYKFWKSGEPEAKDPAEISLGGLQPVKNFESGLEAGSKTTGGDGGKQLATHDPKIIEYAKANNLDYNKAKSVLVKRGYTPQE